MKAMILAAGRGKRMRPLTDHTPKPLLPYRGKMLIEHLLIALQRAGFKEVIINTAHLPEQFGEKLGDGRRYELNITYSPEAPGGLETGGGIFNALPLLGSDPFLVISGDIWTDFPFEQLRDFKLGENILAHLILTDNPDHHPEGDFAINNGYANPDAPNKLNFGNIGIYHPDLFAHCQPGFFPLGPLLKTTARNQQVTAEHYLGNWLNLGTPSQLTTTTA